ncbi:glycoside hydrolase family 65 protein, partial [Pseudomonas sp. BGM005]|nr:glycoside hydrolase family 65 protein [Pseudomonas sp. BG5]
TGVLERTVVWETPSGKRVRMRDERIVSFEERHLAVLRLEVVVENADAPVTVSCQMINRQDGAGVYAGTPNEAKSGFDPRKAEKIADRVLE